MNGHASASKQEATEIVPELLVKNFVIRGFAGNYQSSTLWPPGNVCLGAAPR